MSLAFIAEQLRLLTSFFGAVLRLLFGDTALGADQQALPFSPVLDTLFLELPLLAAAKASATSRSS